jgi:hypothetical protein
VAPEIERHDAAAPRKPLENSAHDGPPDVVREAVTDHEGQVGDPVYRSYVHSVQEDAVM